MRAALLCQSGRHHPKARHPLGVVSKGAVQSKTEKCCLRYLWSLERLLIDGGWRLLRSNGRQCGALVLTAPAVYHRDRDMYWRCQKGGGGSHPGIEGSPLHSSTSPYFPPPLLCLSGIGIGHFVPSKQGPRHQNSHKAPATARPDLTAQVKMHIKGMGHALTTPKAMTGRHNQKART